MPPYRNPLDPDLSMFLKIVFNPEHILAKRAPAQSFLVRGQTCASVGQISSQTFSRKFDTCNVAHMNASVSETLVSSGDRNTVRKHRRYSVSLLCTTKLAFKDAFKRFLFEPVDVKDFII